MTVDVKHFGDIVLIEAMAFLVFNRPFFLTVTYVLYDPLNWVKPVIIRT